MFPFGPITTTRGPCKGAPFCSGEATGDDDYCRSCRAEIERIAGGSPSQDPKLPLDLTDANKLAREVWDYFFQTLKSDKVIGRNAAVQLVETKFDELDLEHSTHFVESIKEIVVNRFATEYRQAIEQVKRQRPAAPPPVAIPMGDPFGLIDHDPPSRPQKSAPTRCYGCGRANLSDKPMCPECLRNDLDGG